MLRVLRTRGLRLVAAGCLGVASLSCGELTRQGQASSYLTITLLEGSSGADPGAFTTNLISDVVTVVDGNNTIFNDLGRVTFALGMKDSLVSPTSNNSITVDRYRVRFIRADGRNTEGVDVPYGFDGAFTVTVSDSAQSGFVLVRNQAKLEAPLRTLQGNGILISTIAEVTFYGHDQTGREVSVAGRLDVTFGNFADPT